MGARAATACEATRDMLTRDMLHGDCSAEVLSTSARARTAARIMVVSGKVGGSRWKRKLGRGDNGPPKIDILFSVLLLSRDVSVLQRTHKNRLRHATTTNAPLAPAHAHALQRYSSLLLALLELDDLALVPDALAYMVNGAEIGDFRGG